MSGAAKRHDWDALLAHRFDPELDEPREWSAAREHLQECASCRREAATLDPTIAFRGAAAWAPSEDDVDAMRNAVRTLRRTGDLRAAAAAPHAPGARAQGRRRIASAALFAAAIALLPGAVDRGAFEPLEPTASLGAVTRPAVQGPVAPAIDGLDRPEARVYEWGAEDLSVVMVVDESLDV